MSGPSKVKEFPDISAKLSAAPKKSVFERQKAEAEAKRLREEAETAAVYEDFVKSFEDEDYGNAGGGKDNTFPRYSGSSGSGFGGTPRRHFTGPSGPGRGALGGARGGRNSGPGSLGPSPSSFTRKRGFDGSQREPAQGLFAFEDSPLPKAPTDAAAAFNLSDDEDQDLGGKSAERAVAKPTLQLSSLPPGSSPAFIKSILPSNLAVDGVRIVPQSGPVATERKSMTAIITLTKDTPASDMDTAVNALQNKYLGFGFYLSISRYLSSAALNSAPTLATGAGLLSSLPFGARPVPTGAGGGLNRAPPPSSLHRGGFAPPSSFTSGSFGRGAPEVQVAVKPPSDLKQLKLIHMTLEALMIYGPEFEALLMSRPEVQREEKWAWLWDSRSTGGVWYRWRLWQTLTGADREVKGNHTELVFEGGAEWVPPHKGLRFEYTTSLEEFVSDPEYDSSEDEHSDDEEYQRRNGPGDGPGAEQDGDGRPYLNPLYKAKLTHLLARLPSTTGRLRKGDVARVTAFAIEHAGRGADEVVDMIVSNIEQPLVFTSASPEGGKAREDNAADNDQQEEGKESAGKGKVDPSSAKLIGLYIVSDILSSSSTSGVRHAWRYRQLFESTLRRRKIFEGLGRLDRDLHWGRLRAEKWKRSVNSLLTLWEGWCVFPQSSQEHFTSVFANPPLTSEEEAAATAVATAQQPSLAGNASKSRWKTVDANTTGSESPAPAEPTGPPTIKTIETRRELTDGDPMEEDEDLDGVPMDDIDGEPMEDSDLDGSPIDQDGGEPMEEADGEGQPTAESQTADPPATAPSSGPEKLNGQSEGPTRRRRPKAEDMFAMSDEE